MSVQPILETKAFGPNLKLCTGTLSDGSKVWTHWHDRKSRAGHQSETSFNVLDNKVLVNAKELETRGITWIVDLEHFGGPARERKKHQTQYFRACLEAVEGKKPHPILEDYIKASRKDKIGRKRKKEEDNDDEKGSPETGSAKEWPLIKKARKLRRKPDKEIEKTDDCGDQQLMCCVALKRFRDPSISTMTANEVDMVHAILDSDCMLFPVVVTKDLLPKVKEEMHKARGQLKCFETPTWSRYSQSLSKEEYDRKVKLAKHVKLAYEALFPPNPIQKVVNQLAREYINEKYKRIYG